MQCRNMLRGQLDEATSQTFNKMEFHDKLKLRLHCVQHVEVTTNDMHMLIAAAIRLSLMYDMLRLQLTCLSLQRQ